MRRDWRTSYDAFTRAEDESPLGIDDLDALAVAAWQLGRGKESVRVTERVFTQLARSDPPSAAMKAVELGLAWFTRGDLNIAQGWMNRARRLLDGAPVGPTNGYLTEAFALLDEAMLPVLAGQVPLDWAGVIYCVVLNQFHHLADLPRLHAWTQSMERWCADFAGSDTYGGVCDVHRLQLLVATDDYRQLRARLVTASQALEDVNGWAAGEGYYQLGEVLRLQGDTDGAFAAFARARTLGVDPQPGEALLRCGRGDGQTAWTDLRVALAGADRVGRMRLLRGAVEVALARNDLDEADQHCRELADGADAFATPGLPRLGRACAWGDSGAARPARRSPCGVAVGVARVPDPEVAV